MEKTIEGLNIVFNGEVFRVLKRKKEINKKPIYFLFNIEKKIYLSSLYPLGEEGAYLFDVKGQGDKYLLRFKFKGGEVVSYEIKKFDDFKKTMKNTVEDIAYAGEKQK